MATMRNQSALKIEETIGLNVKAARLALGWTQVELAERTEGKISREMIAKIEKFHATTISVETLSELGKALCISPYMLMLGEQEWKKLARIALSETFISRYFASAKNQISPDDVLKLESMSKSASSRMRKEAVKQTSQVVDRILNVQEPLPAQTSSDQDTSRIAATAIATSMIPNQPVFNGVIASIISG